MRRTIFLFTLAGWIVLSGCVPFGGGTSLAQNEWQWKHPGDAADQWRTVQLPFEGEQHLGPRFSGRVVLRTTLPTQMALAPGDPQALYVYGLSEAAEFKLNGETFGKLGSVVPFESAFGQAIALPVSAPRVATDAPGTLEITLASDGQYPLYLRAPIELGPAEPLLLAHLRHTTEIGAMLAFFLAIGCYHLIVAARRPQEKYHGYFGLFLLALTVYWFSNEFSRNARMFIGFAHVRYTTELISLYLSCPMCMFFLREMLYEDHDRWSRWYAKSARYFLVASMALAVIALVPHYGTKRITLATWQVLGVAFICSSFAYILRSAWRGHQDARWILLGAGLLGTAALIDIAAAVGYRLAPLSLSKYGLFSLVVCTTIVVANRFVRSQNEVRILNQSLERKVIERTDQLHRSLQDLQRKIRAEQTASRLADVLSSTQVERKLITGKALVYKSRQMQEVMETLEKYANIPKPMLVYGETGTGKELMAKLIHEASRREHPFIGINCATIPESLWEDTVFGHLKGAYTDARTSRPGLVAEAGSGTLFLDEIGEMPLTMQAKMLRLLQERVYNPIGSDTSQPVECRFIFATNRRLDEMVALGTFREDLLYRINVLQLELPPLRDRPEDIPHLVAFFLETYSHEFRIPVTQLDKGALDKLCSYSWPGNVRQLENLIIRALATAPGPWLTAADIELPSDDRPEEDDATNMRPSGERLLQELSEDGFQGAMASHARRVILAALAETNGNKTKTAELLKIRRSSLDYRLRELKIQT